MDKQQWYDGRDDRTLRYASRRLDHRRWIAITASPETLRRFDGQAAILTATNLLGRMTPSIALAFPDVPVHAALPWAGQSLHHVVLAQMRAADPHGQFKIRDSVAADYVFHIGPAGAPRVVHGAGWNAYLGPGPSPLPDADEMNPFGAALAAVLAASQIFLYDFAIPDAPYTCNAFDWRNQIADSAPPFTRAPALGDIWVVGAGSVGTATLYFLTLATRNFSMVLIDYDPVKLHNLDRSPIFIATDIGRPKIEAARDYLRGVGVRDVRIEPVPLHESKLWHERQPGTPDVLISAANEKKVRYYIEAGYPPIQLYATTGRNWQVTLVRHEPFGGKCSLCLFPADQTPGSTACATTPAAPDPHDLGEQVDAALPFLSFAAGLMTAAESIKRLLPGYPFNADRVVLYTKPSPLLISARQAHRDGCFCESRHPHVHRAMLRWS
jgi:hypothetical protein